MSGVEENKSANAATNDPPGESPPDNHQTLKNMTNRHQKIHQILMGLANLHQTIHQTLMVASLHRKSTGQSTKS
ncbi:hypothetical protein JTE90_020335 [Oedothorax gibbosus]|uniref:Uncharacterized protein n=1 Tax=Oedothorax gibbosus TaxID=931172 RepID=A0AAV6VPC9_9ARAC|nr:hypothetical protein JTE90_020335 [Oedothorax gibbosus]